MAEVGVRGGVDFVRVLAGETNMARGAVGWCVKTDSWISLSYRHNRGIRNVKLNTVHIDARWLENARDTALFLRTMNSHLPFSITFEC